MISDIDKGWLAGIVDGEGTITILRRKRTDNKCINHGYQVCIRIANTDKRMIEKIKCIAKEIGGNSGYTNEKRKNRCKKAYYWGAVARQALKMLTLIEPFLVTKKEQAVLAIKMQETMSRKRKKKKLTEQEAAYRNELCQEIRKLNQRGPKRQERTDKA